jgi:hypothetical protein
VSHPSKVKSLEAAYYDYELGLCRMGPAPICMDHGAAEPASTSLDSYQTLSTQQLADDAFAGVSPRNPSLWSASANEFLKNAFSGPMMTACSSNGGPETSGVGAIGNITPLGNEENLNDLPITGKIRQVDFKTHETSPRSAVAWSTADETNLDNPGEPPYKTFAYIRDGDSGGEQVLVAQSVPPTSVEPVMIQRDTAVAVIGNDQTVVAFFRTEGDDLPSDVVARRLGQDRRVVGSEIRILPAAIRVGSPLPRLLSVEEGFVAVYRDGGRLGAAQFDSGGAEIGRITIAGSDSSSHFEVAAGSDGTWALAEILTGNQIRVRTFEGLRTTEVEAVIASTNTIPATPQVSIAMQPDGKMMVAWNADAGTAGTPNPILLGAFLDAGGGVMEGPRLLRDITQGIGNSSEVIFNSHSLAADGRGNFILAYEENRNIVANVYHGTDEDRVLTGVSNTALEGSGPYWEALGGLQNQRVENVDVRAAVSPQGTLGFVYTKVLSGDDPQTNTTTTLHRITRRNFQITYK